MQKAIETLVQLAVFLVVVYVVVVLVRAIA